MKFFFTICLPVLLAGGFTTDAATAKPNIIVILADDLGYGDLGCYGATKIKTPNIDRLARDGMRFTDAHSPASVCTPSRYNLMTGRYCWRSTTAANHRAQMAQWSGDRVMPRDGRYVDHVASGYNDPLMIAEGRMTLASMLKAAGYATACMGKWHLGIGRPGQAGWDDEVGQDWNGTLQPGPLECGFDHFFGWPVMKACPDVFVEDHRVPGLDPSDPLRMVFRRKPLESGRRWWFAEGGKAVRHRQEEADVKVLEKTLRWIEQAASNPQPFFLYYTPSLPHAPLTPSPRFRGSSPIGVYGDAIQELDWCVGEVLAALERRKMAGNTLVIFSSDNGGENAVIEDHRGNGPLRGKKTNVYEGGHRVPFIARWPGRVKAGSASGQLLALTDVLATCAAIVERPLPRNAGEDSFSFLPALLGAENAEGTRLHLVNDSMLGMFSIREGPWKLIECQGSGGYYPNDLDAYKPKPAEPPGQLYNLADDLGETKNLYAEKPEIVARLTALLEKIKTDGRSRP
jgi:arylsulfatase A-like enzyme